MKRWHLEVEQLGERLVPAGVEMDFRGGFTAGPGNSWDWNDGDNWTTRGTEAHNVPTIEDTVYIGPGYCVGFSAAANALEVHIDGAIMIVEAATLTCADSLIINSSQITMYGGIIQTAWGNMIKSFITTAPDIESEPAPGYGQIIHTQQFTIEPRDIQAPNPMCDAIWKADGASANLCLVDTDSVFSFNAEVIINHASGRIRCFGANQTIFLSSSGITGPGKLIVDVGAGNNLFIDQDLIFCEGGITTVSGTLIDI